MTHPTPPAGPSPAERREGFLVGAVVGVALVSTPGARHAATALADALLEELTSGGVDLHRLATRWVTWWAKAPIGADPLLAGSLDHLRDFDAPVATLPAAGLAPIAAALPAALASASPRAMVSGAFHVARLLDPSEESSLAAVAIVVASAALLEGRRDVIPDVLAILRANDAPAAMFEVVNGVLRFPRNQPPAPTPGGNLSPTSALAWLLWMTNQPRGVEVLSRMTNIDGLSPYIAATIGALIGARDGMSDWPKEWMERAGEEAVLRRAIARRL